MINLQYILKLKDLCQYILLTLGNDGKINIEKENKELDKILAEALGLEKVTLIRCGGDDPIAGAREQWNDGANTLAIAPGEVIVYSRNKVTNKLLERTWNKTTYHAF